MLIAVSFAAAVAGDQIGYLFGARVGPNLFTRPNPFTQLDSRLIRIRRPAPEDYDPLHVPQPGAERGSREIAQNDGSGCSPHATRPTPTRSGAKTGNL